jgi:hypothetical protein
MRRSAQAAERFRKAALADRFGEEIRSNLGSGAVSRLVASARGVV